MKNPHVARWMVPALFVALLFTLPAQAGVVLITYGEEIKKLGPVVEEQAELVREATGRSADVGFVYNGAGLFYVDIWTWSGRYCLYSGDQYWELEPQAAAMLLGVPDDELRSPLLYRFPPGLGVLLVLAGLYGIGRGVSAYQEKKLDRLFADERYSRAVDLITHRVQQSDAKCEGDAARQASFDRGVEEAVRYLNAEGISVQRAETDLALMLESMQQRAA